MSGTLHMMVGISGSGKSTYARTLETRLHEEGKKPIRWSSDELRKVLYGSESVQRNNAELFQRLHGFMLEDLAAGRDVIFDATNVALKDRLAFLQKLDESTIKIAYVIATPIHTALKWNLARKRVVPEDVIWRQLRKFSCPSHWEGFDLIRIVQLDGTIDSKEEPYSAFYGFDQKSKWHSLPLDAHCEAVYNEVLHCTRDATVLLAARWHDIGKVFCQTFDEKGEAHYYGHEGVSSYILLTMVEGHSRNLPRAASLIAHHMRPYSWKEEKTKEKYRSLMGPLFFEDLMILHVADSDAK